MADYSLGWRDYYLINGYSLQASGGIKAFDNIVMSEAIHGYGGDPSAQKHFEVNYAQTKTEYNAADLSGNIFIGASDNFAKGFEEIFNHTIDATTRRENIVVAHYSGRATLPNEGGKCLVSNLGMNYTAGQAVAFTASFKATGAILNEEITGTPKYYFEPYIPYDPIVDGNDNYSPLAWWKCEFEIDGISSSIIDPKAIFQFNLSIDNDTYIEYTFGEAVTAHRVSQGRMQVTATFGYYIQIGAENSILGVEPFELRVTYGNKRVIMPHCHVLTDPVNGGNLNGMLGRTANLVMFAGDDGSPSIYED